MDDAAGRAGQIAAALHATGEDLARVRSRPEGSCEAEWGVCPDHGDTLRVTGSRTRCTTSGCGREWEYNRLGTACAEPAVYLLAFAAEPDKAMRTCAGHAVAVRRRGEGYTLTDIPPRPGSKS